MNWTKAETVTIKRKLLGNWGVCGNVKVDFDKIEERVKKRKKATGIDLRVKHLTVISKNK